MYFYLNNAWDFIDTESARCTVNFSGTATPDATINQSYNVSTLTRNSIGYYTIKFSENISNPNMIANGMARTLSSDALVIIPFVGTVSSLEIKFVDVGGTLRDPNPAMITVFGD